MAVFCGGDHFASHRSGGIGRGEQNWTEVKLVSDRDLQITEEHITGRIAAAEETGCPTQVTADQREDPASPATAFPSV